MECLITKLKGIVNDDSLLKVGELMIQVKPLQDGNKALGLFYISSVDSQVRIIGDGYFTDKTLSENKGTILNFNAYDNNYVYVNKGNLNIAISNKYNFTNFGLYGEGDASKQVDSTKLVFNFNDLAYTDGLAVLNLQNAPIIGDISSIKNTTSLTILASTGGELTGNISALVNLRSVTMLDLSNNISIRGDISVLSNMSDLQTLYLNKCSVYGDIAVLNNLTKLTTISIINTKITGTISDLNSLTKVTYFETGATELQGDYFSFLHNNNNASIRCSGTFTYSTVDWNGKTYGNVGGDNFTCIGLDSFLNDFQVVTCKGSGYYISMSGTRTSASNDAISVLQGKGYTVAVPDATDADMISLMSVNSISETYRIAYKGKELIVEPTTLQIYPASDVSVKEFSSLEEANAYISNNGLVKIESK